MCSFLYAISCPLHTVAWHGGVTGCSRGFCMIDQGKLRANTAGCFLLHSLSGRPQISTIHGDSYFCTEPLAPQPPNKYRPFLSAYRTLHVLLGNQLPGVGYYSCMSFCVSYGLISEIILNTNLLGPCGPILFKILETQLNGLSPARSTHDVRRSVRPCANFFPHRLSSSPF